MKKHTILFMAANPSGIAPRALDREARAIQVELKRSGFRDCFEFVTRWAMEPLDVLRELRELNPTVVHFSGQGGQDGLFFQTTDGHAQLVPPAALAEVFGAAGRSVKLVILNACYSRVQADALLVHIDHVVGMDGSIHEDAARMFAIGFYGGLGEQASIADAYRQGRAAIHLQGLTDGEQLRLQMRNGVDSTRPLIVAVAGPMPEGSPQHPSPTMPPCSDVTAIRAHERSPSYSTEETLLAESDANEIVGTLKPDPPPPTKTFVVSSIVVGLFVSLLLMIPVDIISPPAPVGTPQIVLGASGLTICMAWALNHKRRYLRTAISLPFIFAIPDSPFWKLSEITQLAFIGIIYLCFIQDYRTHREQSSLQQALKLALSKLTFSRQLKGLDESRYQIEVIDLTSRHRASRNSQRNSLILGMTALLCVGVWRVTDILISLPADGRIASRSPLDAADEMPLAFDSLMGTVEAEDASSSLLSFDGLWADAAKAAARTNPPPDLESGDPQGDKPLADTGPREEPPHLGSELVERGMILFQAKEYSKARSYFLVANKRFPSPFLLFNIAQTYLLESNIEEALNYYKRVLADPHSPREMRSQVQGLVDKLTADKSHE